MCSFSLLPPLQVGFVLYTLYSDDTFNRKVQQLVDKQQFNGILSNAFRTKLLGLIIGNGLTALASEYLAQGLIKLAVYVKERRARKQLAL